MLGQDRVKLVAIVIIIVLVLTGAVSLAAGKSHPADGLVADPTLEWNTFMGGSSTDWGTGIARNGSGDAFVVGLSYTTWGVPVNAYVGGKDAFVARLDSDGAREWNTFLGSADDDDGDGIAVDGSGNVYIVGTSNAAWNTPIRPFGGSVDAFVAKLNSDGALQWMTFLGGTAADSGQGIALDKNGNVYVVGTSGGTWGSPVAPYPGGWYAPFVAKLNSSGALQWNTFWGAGGLDQGLGIAVDGSDNAYVVGTCYGTWGTPVNPYLDGSEACVAKLNTNGVRQWNTFLGSTDSDDGSGIIVDGSGNVYVTGRSYATWGTPINPHGGPNYDPFVAKLNSSDGVRQWNTFMGFSNTSEGYGIAVDGAGGVYVTGESKATLATVFYDAFLAKLDSDGAREWNVSMGATYNHDYGHGVVLDESAHAYVAGFSLASWGAPINAYSDGADAFVARLLLPAQSDLAMTKSVEPGVNAPGGAIAYTLSFSNRGDLTAEGVLISDVVPDALTNVSFTGSGAAITPTGGISYTWQVQDLAPGAGGVITITGIVNPGLEPGTVFTNTASITSTTADGNPGDNSSSVTVLVPSSWVFLPQLVKD